MLRLSVKTGVLVCPAWCLCVCWMTAPQTKEEEKKKKKVSVSFGPARGLTRLPWKQSRTSDRAVWDRCGPPATLIKHRWADESHIQNLWPGEINLLGSLRWRSDMEEEDSRAHEASLDLNRTSSRHRNTSYDPETVCSSLNWTVVAT